MSEHAYDALTAGQPVSARPEGEIAAAHRELEGVVEDIAAQLARLTDGLEPALRPNLPSIGNDIAKAADVPQTGVRVADDLSVQVDRLRGVRNRLRDLTDRLAL